MRSRSLASAPSIVFALTSALTLVVAGSAHATNYGDFIGDTVTFEQVTDADEVFGAPIVSGDSLDFNPNSFEVACPDGGSCPPTPALLDGTLTLQIRADSGYFIPEIVLSEAGDTTLASFLDALGATSVSASVFVDVYEVDGVSVNNINANAQMVFTSDGTFRSDEEGYGTHIWTGSLSLDIDQIITDAGASGQATYLGINLDNTLTAYAAEGATARIEKKDVDGLAITVVPEPGAALLLGLGLAGLASIRRSSDVS
jgi:hypothetical protein